MSEGRRRLKVVPGAYRPHCQPLTNLGGIIASTVMALSQVSQEAAEQALLEDGYFCWEDASAGDRVMEMEKKKFPYYSEYGLEFCADFAFDPVSQTYAHFGCKS